MHFINIINIKILSHKQAFEQLTYHNPASESLAYFEEANEGLLFIVINIYFLNFFSIYIHVCIHNIFTYEYKYI